MPENTVHDPTDMGTLRPDEPAIKKAGAVFQPLEVDERPTHITLPDGVSPERPYSLFALYYTPKIIQIIVDATNAYKRVVGDGVEPRGVDWYDTTPQEIYLYLALRIYMTLHVENEIVNYWSTSPHGPIHPITKYLSKNRFVELHVRFRVGQDNSTIYSRVIPPPPPASTFLPLPLLLLTPT